MKEINPDETSRAEAFRLWMNAPMPMVTRPWMLQIWSGQAVKMD